MASGVLGRRRLAARLVAADATAYFAGLEVHKRAHPFDFHVVLVEGLEEQAAPCRDREMRRAILGHWYHAVQYRDEDVRTHADGRVLPAGDVVRPEPFGGPGTRHLFQDAQVLHLPPFDPVQTAVHIGHQQGRFAVICRRSLASVARGRPRQSRVPVDRAGGVARGRKGTGCQQEMSGSS